jgi:hypothetical protein
LLLFFPCLLLSSSVLAYSILIYWWWYNHLSISSLNPNEDENCSLSPPICTI